MPTIVVVIIERVAGPSNATPFGPNALILVVGVVIAVYTPVPPSLSLSIGTQDYPLADDIASDRDTPVVYAWRLGEGIGIHSKNQRGSVLLNFADGTLTPICSGSSDYYALHGALLLFAWLVVAPYGIYQAR